MAKKAFDRRVKIVIGKPQIDTAAYTVTEENYVVANRETVFPATTEPAGDIISISNTGDNTRGFYFSLDTTRGSAKGGSSSNEKTIIEIANLNEESLAVLYQSGCKVMVYLGYKDTPLELYYTGDIYDIRPSSNGLDKIYKITCKDGAQDAQNTRVSLSYDESMSIADIIKDMAGRFPSGSLGTLALDSVESKFIQGGVNFQGNLERKFDAFCKMHGINYFRYNGKINLQPYQLVNGTPEYLLVGRNTFTLTEGTIKAIDPIIQNGGKYLDNTNTKRGVQVRLFLTPIEIGDFFTVPPEISKELAGTYKTTTTKISVSMPNGDFDITVKGEPM